MNSENAISSDTETNKGMLFGFMGVVLFSFTLPMNRLIVPYFDPIFVGMGRSVVAVMVAIPILIFFK